MSKFQTLVLGEKVLECHKNRKKNVFNFFGNLSTLASRYSISASRYNISAFQASDMSIIARLAGHYGDNRPASLPVQNFVSRYEKSALK